MLQELKEKVCTLNVELPKCRLVVWTSGNVSGRDVKTGYVVIKPSGVKYEQLKPENMVVVDLQGQIVEGQGKPSFDTATHLYVYRQILDGSICQMNFYFCCLIS